MKGTALNCWLTPASHRLLHKLVDSKEGELVYCKGGGWWIGNSRVRGGRAVDNLIELCLIHRHAVSSDDYHVYTVRPEGLKVLEDDTHRRHQATSNRRRNRVLSIFCVN